MDEDDDIEITEADLEEAGEIFDRLPASEDPQWTDESAGELKEEEQDES